MNHMISYYRRSVQSLPIDETMFDLRKHPQSITQQTTVQLEQPQPSDPVQQPTPGQDQPLLISKQQPTPDQDQPLLISQQQSLVQQQSPGQHQSCPPDQKVDSHDGKRQQCYILANHLNLYFIVSS